MEQFVGHAAATAVDKAAWPWAQRIGADDAYADVPSPRILVPILPRGPIDDLAGVRRR